MRFSVSSVILSWCLLAKVFDMQEMEAPESDIALILSILLYSPLLSLRQSFSVMLGVGLPVRASTVVPA